MSKRISRKELLDVAVKNNIELMIPNRNVYKYVLDKTNSRERAVIVGNRYKNIYHYQKYYSTPLSVIMSAKFIKKLPDIDKAIELIDKHVKNNSRILQVTDYDVDGITAGVIGYKIFKNIFKYRRFKVLVNNRSWKNGMNDTIINQILEQHKQKPIGLVITSDHGSSDGDRLKRLKEAGIDVIVTDHHIPSITNSPEGIVDAFVNHKRSESLYTLDITGTAVLFFTYYYYYLKKMNVSRDVIDKFYKLLLYVGLTTISDSVDLSEWVNRKIVRYMLNLLNNDEHIDPFWDVVKEQIFGTWFIDQEFLSFNLIAKLNSPGRIHDPTLTFRLMIANSKKEAYELLEEVTEINNKRKEIQNEAMDDLDIEYINDNVSIVYREGLVGIQGIIASKLMFKNSTPVSFCFTDTEEGILAGSGRSLTEDYNLVEILRELKNKPYMVNFGGHAGACGIDIKKEDIYRFIKDINEIMDRKFKGIITKLKIDDVIHDDKKLNKVFFANLAESPYGQGFPKPMYLSKFKVISKKLFEKHKNHFLVATVRLVTDKGLGHTYKLLYSLNSNDLNILNRRDLEYVTVAYTIGLNSYRKNNELSIAVEKILSVEYTE